MKYLIISKNRYYSDGYQVREFATQEELTEQLQNTDTLAKDVIIAQRLGMRIELCEWVPPVEEKEEAEIELTEAVEAA